MAARGFLFVVFVVAAGLLVAFVRFVVFALGDQLIRVLPSVCFDLIEGGNLFVANFSLFDLT